MSKVRKTLAILVTIFAVTGHTVGQMAYPGEEHPEPPVVDPALTNLPSFKPEGPINDISNLPTLRGTSNPFRLFITQENEKERGLPLAIHVVEHAPSAVRIDLTVSQTNEFADLADAYVYVNVRQDTFWVPISPVSRTAGKVVYRFNLPRSVAKQSYLVLACGRDMSRPFPDDAFWVLFRQLYKETYTIDLGSYCRRESTPQAGTPKAEKQTEVPVNVVIE